MFEIFNPFLFPITVSALFTLMLIRFVLDFFPKWKLLDKPEKYGLTRKPVPYATGLILYVNFLVISLAFLPFNQHVAGMIIGATLLVVIGFIDDFKNLPPLVRLFFQILAAMIIIVSGFEIATVTNPLGGTIPLDIISINIMPELAISVFSALFLILWIVGMINTVNFLDGVPGLASGITVIAGLVLFLLAIRPNFHVINQETFALLAGTLTISVAVFWIFDSSPPKILMGDTGSTFLGFLLALFAIFSGGKIATAFIVMGFPIFDVLMTVARRILQKKSPFHGDRQHLHHDLLNAGFSEKKTALIIYALSALFGLTALFLGSLQKLIAISVIFIIMIIMKITLIKKAAHSARNN